MEIGWFIPTFDVRMMIESRITSKEKNKDETKLQENFSDRAGIFVNQRFLADV